MTRTVRLAGDLDATTAPAAADAVTGVAGRGDVRVDLSRVTSLDGEGIRSLVRASRALEGRGRLILVEPSRRILRSPHLSDAVVTSPNMLLIPPAAARPASVPPGPPRPGGRPFRPRPPRPRPDPLSCDDESIP